MPPQEQKYEQNLRKLDRFFSLMDGMSEKEFEKAFRVVLEFVIKIQKRNAEEIEAMNRMHEEMMKEMKGGNTEVMSEMKKKMMDYCAVEMQKMYREHEGMMAGMEKMMKDQQEGMKFIYDKLRTMKSGKDADEEVIVGKVLTKIPELKPEEIRDKLESLKGEERLDKSAIKGLEDEIKSIRDILSNIPRGRSMGRARTPITRWIYLTDQVDGATVDFVLPPDVVAVHGLISTQFPQAWNTTDFSFAGRTLTTNFTMQSGQTLVAICDVLFYP